MTTQTTAKNVAPSQSSRVRFVVAWAMPLPTPVSSAHSIGERSIFINICPTPFFHDGAPTPPRLPSSAHLALHEILDDRNDAARQQAVQRLDEAVDMLALADQ